MPFLRRSGVRIHYLVQGHGKPLVLQHGFAGAAGIWQHLGYVAPLLRQFQVISVDARGHGASDKPHDPEAYTQDQYALDILAVLDQAGVRQTHLLGYSMGAWVGYGVARIAPERLLSLHAGGSGLACQRCTAFDTVNPNDKVAFLDAMESLVGEPLSSRQRDLIGRLDLHALTAAMRAPATITEPEVLRKVHTQLFCGTEDSRYLEIAQLAQETASEFFAVPGTNHMRAILQRELVVDQLLGYLRRLRLAD